MNKDDIKYYVFIPALVTIFVHIIYFLCGGN